MTHFQRQIHSAARVRRAGLALALSSATIFMALAPAQAAPAPAAAVAPAKAMADIAIIRQRVVEAAQSDATPTVADARKLANALTPAGTWPDLNYKDQADGRWSPTEHLSRVQRLALAYAKPKLDDGQPNSNFHSAPLLAALTRAYDAWFSVIPSDAPRLKVKYGNAFKDDLMTPVSRNWWHNEIGVPLKIAAILALVPAINGERQNKGLTIMARSWVPGGNINTGANLSWRARVTTTRAALTGDVALMNQIVDTLNTAFAFGQVEGPQPDYSFHQHGPQFYLLGYGLGFTSDMTELSALYGGTSFTFKPELPDLLTHLTLEGYQWVMRGPHPDPNAMGRGIANPRRDDTSDLVKVVDRLLALDTGREAELRAFKARLLGQKDAPPLVGNRAFFSSGVMEQHRAGYSVSVRVTPVTLRGGELINGAGQQSRYTGDGVTYLMREGNEYRNLFPVVNFRLLPGTTGALASAPPKMPGPYVEGVGHFAGGVSDGTYGAVGYDYARDGVSARKGWFFFDDEYVGLGAGISAQPSVTDAVVSSIEQRRAANPIVASDKAAPGAPWIAQDGTGYLFLDTTADVRGRVGPQSGSWRAINSDSSDKKTLTETVFSLYLDHGTGPRDASYAYLVKPNATPETLPAYAAALPIAILSNTPQLQAVRHAAGITEAIFYAPGTLQVSPALSLQISRRCLLLFNEATLQLTIADPNDPALPDSVNGKAPPLDPAQAKLVPAPVTVEIKRGDAAPQTLRFDLPAGLLAGQSVTQKLANAGAAMVRTKAAALETPMQNTTSAAPRTAVYDGAALARLRERIRGGDHSFDAALQNLREDADKAMKVGPFSVMQKDKLPPSGDKHDYLSQSIYWWPNPNTPDGLPYVGRDGQINPETKNITDERQMLALGRALGTLAQAWYFTGQPAYAERAALLLRTWFLDPRTRMNPNLEYAGFIPGVAPLGRSYGIVDTESLVRIPDAAALLADSGAWTDQDDKGLRSWFGAYADWLVSSEHGKKEAQEKNNHGTVYAAQLASFALYAGNDELAKQTLEAIKPRIAEMIEPDGRQPSELKRTKAWTYSNKNLQALMWLAMIGEAAGVDLWNYQTPDGRSLRAALDYLIPFALGQSEWTYQRIDIKDGQKPRLISAFLFQAANAYHDPKYVSALQKLVPDYAASGNALIYPLEAK